MAEPTPWEHPLDALRDAFERARLLLERYATARWFTITDGTTRLSDLRVSFYEVQLLLRTPAAPATRLPPEDANLRPLTAIEADLTAHAAHLQARAEATLAAGRRVPLEDLRAAFDLPPDLLELLLLLAGLALDPALLRLATWAWADFTTRQPTLGFLAEVVALDDAHRRAALLELGLEGHPLLTLGVIEAAPPERWAGPCPPQLLRLALPHRLLVALQGDALPAPRRLEVAGLGATARLWTEPLEEERALPDPPALKQLIRALRLLRSPPPRGALLDPAALGAAIPLLLVSCPDPRLVDAGLRRCLHPEPLLSAAPPAHATSTQAVHAWLQAATREARLCGALLHLSLGEALEDAEDAARWLDGLRRILRHAGGPVVISCARASRALAQAAGPCPQLHLPLPDPLRRRAIWEAELAEAAQPELDWHLTELANRYTLSAFDVAEATLRARWQASLRDGRRALLQADELHQGVRAQIEHKLSALADVFTTPLVWEDLILPPDLEERLREIIAWSRDTHRVHETWGFGRLSSYGAGLSVLMAGPPGTGKTLSAAIIAREMGCELYRVDLSRTVDKYIGETEKNLGRIFDEATRSRAALLFDEADSLFAKRTEVKSSNDRYANLEVNYLLQRMEHFDGVTFLTTNLKEGLDEAFQRRIRFRVDFRLPEAHERERIWRRMIPPQAPLEEGVAWAKLAQTFEMAPGHIKNAVLRAAFWAARRDEPLTHTLLWEAAAVEYRELGNLVREERATPVIQRRLP